MKLNLSNIFVTFNIYRDLKKNFILILLLSVFIIILYILGIFLLAYLVALVLNFELSDSILNQVQIYLSNFSNSEIIIFILFIFLIKFIFNLLTYKKIFNYIKKEQLYLGNKFADKIFNLKISKKENIKLFSAFTEFLRLSSEYYLVYFLKFISEFFILISIIILLFIIDYKLNIFLLFSISIFILFFFKFGRTTIKNYGKKVTQNYEKFLNKSKYLIYSIKEIKAFKRDDDFKNNTLRYFNKYSEYRFKQIFISFTPRLYAELFFIILLLFIAFYINLQSSFSVDNLSKITLFTMVLIRAIPLTSACIFSLTNIWNFSYANKIVYDNLKNFKNNFYQNKNLKSKINLQQIKVSNLTFSYNKNLVFKNLSFKINSNEIFGVLGKSGSGKTTLGLILMGSLSQKKESYLYKR